MKIRRKMENCEPATEEFLKANPRFSATDGWFLTWCRMGNGGDPSNHLGPFREDQLYLSSGELMTVYPAAGMALFELDKVNTEDLYFPVIAGALLAYKKNDGEDSGWIYHEGEWKRLP